MEGNSIDGKPLNKILGGGERLRRRRASDCANLPLMQKTTKDTTKTRNTTAPMTISTMAHTGNSPLPVALSAVLSAVLLGEAVGEAVLVVAASGCAVPVPSRTGTVASGEGAGMMTVVVGDASSLPGSGISGNSSSPSFLSLSALPFPDPGSDSPGTEPDSGPEPEPDPGWKEGGSTPSPTPSRAPPPLPVPVAGIGSGGVIGAISSNPDPTPPVFGVGGSLILGILKC